MRLDRPTGTLATELTDLSHTITVAAGEREAMLALGRRSFDAVLLDRTAPAEGLPVLRLMRAAGLKVPIILLSAMLFAADTLEALDAGADDCVAKPAVAEELDARLRAIVRGRRWSKPGADTLTAGDITVSPAAFRAWRGGRAIDLGRLEVRLLAELVRGADAVLGRATLVKRVWGPAFDPRSNIVDVHIRRLRRKLTQAGGNDPIRTVRTSATACGAGPKVEPAERA